MKNKKFTDAEIIKVLECCYLPKGFCENCPLRDEDCSNVLDDVVTVRRIIDLINRQKAEIEKLRTIASFKFQNR